MHAFELEVDETTRTFDRNSFDGWYNPRLNLSFFSNETKSLLDHEGNHFSVHVSSPYGYLFSSLTSLSENLVIEFCKDTFAVCPHSTVHVPLYNYTRTLLTSEKAIDDLGPVNKDRIDLYIAPWSSICALLRIFEGGQSKGAINPTADNARQLLSKIERIYLHKSAEPLYQSLPIASLPPNLGPVPACPQVSRFGQLVSIGAHHLQEAIAEAIGSDIDKLFTLLDYKHEHFITYNYLWHQFLVDIVKDKKISIDNKISLKNTFISLAYLALFCPCGPQLMKLRQTDISWLDLHPGWRFRSAVKVSKQLGLIDDIQSELHTYSNEICRLLKWPTIVDFMENISSLPSNCHENDNFIMSIAHQREAQKSNPNMKLTEQLFDEYLRRYGPVSWIDSKKELRMHYQDIGVFSDYMNRLIRSQCCWILMLEGVPNKDSIFSQGFDLLEQRTNSRLNNDIFYESWISVNPIFDPGRFTRFEGGG